MTFSSTTTTFITAFKLQEAYRQKEPEINQPDIETASANISFAPGHNTGEPQPSALRHFIFSVCDCLVLCLTFLRSPMIMYIK